MTAAPGSDEAFLRLAAQIRGARGIDCAAYKERCLRRRIAVRMRATGVHTYEAYAAVLDRVPEEYDRLLDALTINVTRFYRNPETWVSLTTRYLPEIWQARRGAVRCWSAGCATGEEAYSVAIGIGEVARAAGDDSWLERARIDATDVDRASLAKARAGVYEVAALEELPLPLRARYFAAAPYQVPASLKRLVRFVEHDLTREPPPYPPYDLIVCRNTVIYFDRPTQERLFDQFASALAPDGLLMLGRVETLVGTARARFVLLDLRERIYRRAS